MLYAFVEGVAGAIVRARAIEGGTTSRVWCVETANGRVAVKQHGRGRAFAQETAALAALPADDDAPWPRLLARDPAQLALVTTWLPGTSARSAAREPATRAAIYAAAGLLRRRLDAVPCPVDDPVSVRDALERRMDAQLDRSALAPAVIAAVRAAFRPDAFVGATRSFCHRDFAPRNWLVEGASLRVVDFGHARADHPLVDLARALSPVWGEPRARTELLAAYGLDEDDTLRQLELLELLDMVATVTWARGRGDHELATRADAALATMLRTTGSRT
jgi:hypothetical protein